jgi:hypothetical protein
MRLLTLAAALAFMPAAFAQHNPTGSYGNVLHPGVPSPGALRPPAPVPPMAGGARIGGGGRIGGGRIGGGLTGGRRSFGGGAVYIPYPVYGGYGMGYGFDGFYASDYPVPGGSNPGPGYTEPYSEGPYSSGPPVPTVIINQNFQTDSVRPQLRDYSNVPLPEPGAVAVPPASAAQPATPVQGALADDQPTIFLIAMQDHTILPVIAYWVQGDTLNYISLEGAPNHVSLALVDRNFSKQLNAERNVPFALPAAR